MMVRFPNRISPGKYSQLIGAVDVLPTLLDLCGLPVAENVQGQSFAPLITGNPDRYTPREAIFCENIIPEVFAPPNRKGTEVLITPLCRELAKTESSIPTPRWRGRIAGN